MKKNGKRKISINFFSIILIILVASLIIGAFGKNSSSVITSILGKEDKYNATTSANSSAKEIVKDMGLGWNYGARFAGGNLLQKEFYKIKVVFEEGDKTQEINGNFNAQNGTITLEQQLQEFTSDARIGIQILNEKITDCGNTKVKYRVDSINLKLSNGSNIQLNGVGTYSYALNTQTEVNYITDLANINNLNTDSATFSMKVSIIDYALQKSTTQLIEQNPNRFDAVKAAGFGTVRLPVTFLNYIDAEGNIDPSYLDKVQKTVDMILERDLYCIIDIHHDAGNIGWLSVGYVEEHKEKYQNMWKQIATKFANYDYHLIFEGTNEPLNFLQASMWDVYDTKNVLPESIRNVNKLNQYFIDVVRSVPGNENRFLMLSSYANKEFAYVNTFLEDAKFEMPTDTAQDKLLIDAHIYTNTSKDMEWRVNALKSSGYATYIGEFGLTMSDVTNNQTAREAQIHLVKIAAQAGIQCAIWDDGGSMTVLKTTELTDDNYSSKDIWIGSESNYIPDLVAASKTEEEEVAVTGITFNKPEITLEVGQTEQLQVTITPGNAANLRKTFKSSDEKVATVEGDILTAVGVGTATITATTVDGGKTATCKVTVTRK